MRRLTSVLLPAATMLAILIAVPVLAGGNPNAPGQQKDKAPTAPITILGTIERSTDAAGRSTYTVRDGGTTYTLGAGPWWFYGDDHPLDPFVGESVTIVGEIAKGSSDIDVDTVNGKALREAGKPPWAGGWKAVGEAHPGWSQVKADRFESRFGECWPPGHCKEGPAGADDEADETE